MSLIGSKKKQELNYDERVKLIDKHNPRISIRRQCVLLSISKSSTYYEHGLSDDDLKIMNLIDEIYTKCPFYWARRIKAQLRRLWIDIWKKKVSKYMYIMGIEWVWPRKKTSIPDIHNKKYPYLLTNIKILRPNQVWACDITYIRLRKWRIYLFAIMDWYSRYTIAWDISISLDEGFCDETLKKALLSCKPEIFNTDQGSQFTSLKFTGILEKAEIRISMDWKWRYRDNIFIERLWRTIKYEEVYMKDYEDPRDAYDNLKKYIEFYNNERLHSSLDYKTPAEVYFNKN